MAVGRGNWGIWGLIVKLGTLLSLIINENLRGPWSTPYLRILLRPDLKQRSQNYHFNFLMKKKLLVILTVGIYLIALAVLVWLLIGDEQLFGVNFIQIGVVGISSLRQGLPVLYGFSNFNLQSFLFLSRLLC